MEVDCVHTVRPFTLGEIEVLHLLYTAPEGRQHFSDPAHCYALGALAHRDPPVISDIYAMPMHGMTARITEEGRRLIKLVVSPE